MAQYKDETNVKKVSDTKFDTEYNPGDTTPYPGIYRCIACTDEIGIAQDKTLPPQNHQQQSPGAKSKWKLLDLAQQK